MHQIRVAQAEARAAAVVSSEAVAQESLRHVRDLRIQEWTRSGAPVPAIGETLVLLGTPIMGWGPLFGTPQALPENPEGPTAAIEGEDAEQPLENEDLENGEQGPLIPLEDVSSLPRGEPTQANEST